MTKDFFSQQMQSIDFSESVILCDTWDACGCGLLFVQSANNMKNQEYHCVF